ncbi:glycosyltransferase family 1 protein [Leptospira yasudae]|nr:glycosyltransferase family 1 protein [Leptospira yasudae]TGM05671.1 glycosyltransferase family 1 protein [Leptospira yasudae]
MKILYDHQIFSMQNYGGISRYFYELMTRIRRTPGMELEHSVLYSSNEYLKDRELFPLEKKYGFNDFLPSIRFRGMYRIFRFLQYLGLIPFPERKMNCLIENKIKHLDFDVFHPTYYSPYFLKSLSKRKKPFVLTVYDLIHEKFPQYFSDAKEVIQNKKSLIEKADLIIAISESTKRDLLTFYNISENKVKVVHLGASLAENSFIESIAVSSDRYILFTGNRAHYKNFIFFLRSISSLFQRFTDVFLYCAGGGSFTSEEVSIFEELNLENRIRHVSFENDEGLATYYKNALLFVFPSQYEGFGIPLLEAFSCGCPVACSDTSSFPEVAGDAAFYFNPNDSESIYNSVSEAIENEDLRKQKISNGKIQIQKFSWNRAAVETLQFYYDVIKECSTN